MTGVCPRCGAVVSDPSRPCPSCGAVISSQSQMPTEVATGTRERSPARSNPIGRLDSGTERAQFTPGEILDGRYRVIGLLGRGGMGEVYRADDLELGQPVSLKFLPAALASAPGALERFRAEVRHARQVSHPNVCRVYDIGEYQGLHFLSMEFVDGEDLATLLKRIGRLPGAKANEVASQLCAGLAAAHDKGVLHRDLKPSNVMLDGEGHVRITDFGLAVRLDEGVGDQSGTPAYMAPEQFGAGPVTTRSDLYSLGLVLYEVYTGRRPFDANTIAEWRSRHTESAPRIPSEQEPDLDEAVERAILRCLEKDPSRRPESARQLAAALPGGDPLAAALAAGETPSPEMVAAAGGEGALSLRTAWTLMAGIAVGVALIVALGPYSGDLGLAPLRKSPAVLDDRARDLLARFGYGNDALDSEAWLERIYAPMLYVAKRQPSRQWREAFGRIGPPLLLVRRQSPRWMPPQRANGFGNVTRDDPPHDVSGMAMVAVDAQGALRQLQAVPPQVDPPGIARPPDWGAMFAEARFDTARFRPVRPTWVPSMAYDARAEWIDSTGALGYPLRVAAATYRGQPVSFEIIGPWSVPERMERRPVSLTTLISGYTIGALVLVAAIATLFMTRRNLRLGRGDRRGALRIATFLFLSTALQWILAGHHVRAMDLEINGLLNVLGTGLLFSALAAVVYLAIEPYVRRRMPDLMIGWARLLEGRILDPRVGRDVLIGGVLGTASALIGHFSNALPAWMPILGQTPVPPDPRMIEGGAQFVASLVTYATFALQSALFLFAFLFVLRVILRGEWTSIVAIAVVLTLANLGGENVALETPFAVVQALLMAYAIGRVGLLAMASMWFFRILLGRVPLPLDFAAPYAAATVIVLALLLALAAFGFRRSVGSRPVFSAPALD